MERSARYAPRNAAARPHRVKTARERHLKNALRSCGRAFADDLRSYYADHYPVPKKAGYQ